MRNTIPLEECYRTAYLEGPTIYNPAGKIPDAPELPLILDKVYPCKEIVKIDYCLPGCPPSGDAIWQTLSALISGKPIDLPYELIKYD